MGYGHSESRVFAMSTSESRAQSPPGRRISWTAVCVFVALASGVWFLTRHGGFKAGEHPAVGQRVVQLSLQPLNHEGPAITADDIKGKVVLLNFWGPWCGPCRRELPHLVEIEGELADHADFRLLLVACTSEFNPFIPPGVEQTEDTVALLDDVRDYLERRDLEAKVYADPDGTSRRMLSVTGVWQDRGGYPTTLLLDREGVIRGVWAGYRRGAEKEMRRNCIEHLEGQ
jgi:cytochrome c biogenesis protein CcmG/thiol:disulfide interchange protein DsbE